MGKICFLCGNKVVRYRSDICGTCMVMVRRMRLKLATIRLLGAKCIKCGLDATLENLAAFQFHHRNPEEKEFQLSFGTYSWKKIKAEAVKCDLWCANCHSVHHATTYSADRLKRAIRFDGDKDINILVRSWNDQLARSSR